MPETRVLLEHAEDPKLRTIDGYRAHGGYATLEKAYREMEADEILKELEDSGLRGRGGAGFSMGKKASFLPRGGDGQVPLLQRGRVRAGRLQGPRADAAQPAPADRGDRDRGARSRHRPRLHLHPRRVRPAGRHPRRRGRRSLRGGLPGQGHPRHPSRPRAGRPPRRRRLHLRRGDGAARRARGQARQPAAEAALPGGAGPLRRADPDQQRRDALQRAADRRQGRRVVQGLRHRAVAGHQGRLGLRLRAAAGQLRGRARDPDPGADLRPRRRAAGGPRGEGLLPRRLLLPRAHRRGGTRPPLQLRGDGRGGLDARLRLGDRRRRPGLDPAHGAAHGALLPPRVLRQVHPMPRGHQLDGEDARAGRARRGDADGPRHRRLGAGEHHRPLPLRARRLDGDAGRRDGAQVPPGVRGRDGRRRRAPSRRWSA